MVVFFQTWLGKILIWQKFSGMWESDFNILYIKGTAMQIEKALKNDRSRVSKVSWKFCTPSIYNFAVIYPWNWQFS